MAHHARSTVRKQKSLQQNKKWEKVLEHVRAMLEYKEKMRAHCHCVVWLCLLVNHIINRC